MVKAVMEDESHAQQTRLKELVRFLHTLFVTEKKAALPLEGVIHKIMYSELGYSASSAQSDIDSLVAKASTPAWISKPSLRNGVFLKVDRAVNIQSIINAL